MILLLTVMRSEDLPTSGIPAEGEAEPGRLDRLTEAISFYLEEIDGYRRICLRHEQTTGVYATRGALHLIRIFPWKEETLAHIRLEAEWLPRWEKSPFWRTNKRSWMQLQRDKGRRQREEDVLLFVNCGIAWEGRPVLVTVAEREPKISLRLELLLPYLQLGLPELPLRVVASGLTCLEHLIPEHIVTPFPASTAAGEAIRTPRAYLKRAMPRNLYASQCLLTDGAEQ